MVDVPITVWLKGKIVSLTKPVVTNQWVQKTVLLALYSACIWFVLTLFDKKLSLLTFMASVGLYFIYQEVIGDLKRISIYLGGKK